MVVHSFHVIQQFSLPMDRKFSTKSGIAAMQMKDNLLDHQVLKTAVVILLLVYMHL